MKPGDLDELMKKYYEGNTSLEEERQLQSVLNGQDAPDTLLPEKDILGLFENEKRVKRANGRLPGGKPVIYFPLFLKIAASLLLVGGLAWLVYQSASEPEAQMLEWRTTSQMQEQRQLPDGSVVTLNANSLLRYPEQFSKSRQVVLEGEAFFEVQKDEKQPFRVATGNVTTEVLGTAFNLKWDRPGQTVELEVTEGKVAFASFQAELSERIFVSAGEQAVYHGQTNTIERFEVFNPNLISWKTKKLVFSNATVSKVLEDASVYFDVNFTVEDESIKNCKFSGTLDNPELEDFLRALEYVLRSRYEINDKTIRLMGNGC